MPVVETFEVTPVRLTKSAAQRMKVLINEKDNPKLNFRVFVTGGGCSGFQYGFSFDETINDDDTILTHDGSCVLIDSLSIQYLTGSELDYVENLQGSRFVIQNPIATTTCGCGMSFSV